MPVSAPENGRICPGMVPHENWPRQGTHENPVGAVTRLGRVTGMEHREHITKSERLCGIGLVGVFAVGRIDLMARRRIINLCAWAHVPDIKAGYPADW